MEQSIPDDVLLWKPATNRRCFVRAMDDYARSGKREVLIESVVGVSDFVFLLDE